jgi:hypothetical protein
MSERVLRYRCSVATANAADNSALRREPKATME